MAASPLVDRIRGALVAYPDFPSPGVLFQDIFPLFRDPPLVKDMIEAMAELAAKDAAPDVIVGLDARGFMFGALLGQRLGVPFVPIRKAGKLPGPCVRTESVKEYGKDVLELPLDGVSGGARVVVVDDLLATGGTLAAAVRLVREAGGTVAGCVVAVEIEALRGREKVDGVPVHALVAV